MFAAFVIDYTGKLTPLTSILDMEIQYSEYMIVDVPDELEIPCG